MNKGDVKPGEYSPSHKKWLCPKCGLPASKQYWIPTKSLCVIDWQCERCQRVNTQPESKAVKSEAKWSARREGLVPMKPVTRD